jgi:DNA-binding TFAR19-related protein (PDSD5 family)
LLIAAIPKAFPGFSKWSILKFMNALLEKALEAVRRLSPDDQEEIAHVMLNLADKGGHLEEIDPEHLSDVLESLAQARRREFAADAEVAAVFRRFGS